MRNEVVLAIDPGYSHGMMCDIVISARSWDSPGCKVAVLGRASEVLEHCVIYPHKPQARELEAIARIEALLTHHNCHIVAIGNGTACRETETMIGKLQKKHRDLVFGHVLGLLFS